MSEAAKFKFGAWSASPALNLLERGTRSIRIEPRAMDVLVFLAGRNGAVVPIDELIASVWKGVIVSDSSVYLAISQLRQALDDPADDTRHIETISKRGYRLTVPVEWIEPESAPASVAPSPPAERRRARGMWLAAAAIGALIIAGFALLSHRDARIAHESSVAVLPFDNLSSDPEQEYFADGITAEILNTLSRIRDLRVTARASSFHFKDRNEDLRTIGQTLGTEHVLQGSVRKAGDQVRITAQLSNARTGEHLWSDTYERKLGDIFQIQDQIAKAVADALQVKLGVGDVGRAPGMTHNVEAYDEYLRGMALNLEARPQSFPAAIEHLQRAVALDPAFSLAWAGLSTVYVNGAFVVPSRADEWREKSMQSLDQARTLTPDAPHVLLETGIAEARRGNWRDAAVLFERLQKSYAQNGRANQAWGARGTFLLCVGRIREAIPALERARAEDPLAPAYALFLQHAYIADGNVAGALAEVDRGLRLEGLEAALLKAGLINALNSDDQAEIERRLRAIPEGSYGASINRELAQFIGKSEGVAARIRELAASADTGEKALLAQWAAYYHEPELSLALTSESVSHLAHPSMLWQPLMRDVRKLPAFKELVRKMGFVDYWYAYGWSDFCRPLNEEDFVCS